MEQILRFEFPGKTMTRDDVENTNDQIFAFLDKNIPKLNIFLKMTKEIIKNICDHAKGCGYAIFIKNDGFVKFEISSQGSYFDYEEFSIDGASTKDKEYNRGIGLGIIAGSAELLSIELQISQNNGLLYEGTWNYNR